MIHRFWTGPPPPADYLEALTLLHPDDEVVTWTPSRLPPWVRDLTERTAHLVVPERQAQHAANVARAAVLAVHGGWWADFDLEPHRSFYDLAFPATAAHSDGTRCSCWLGFGRGAAAPLAVLDAIASASEGPPRPAVEVSGERIWGAVTSRVVPALEPHGWATHHRWSRRVPARDAASGRPGPDRPVPGRGVRPTPGGPLDGGVP